jgi:hypothetical protein
MCNRALLLALLLLFGGEATAQTPNPDPNSKSAAEFTLTSCLAAMDDLAKVEVMARENNWTNKTPPISANMSKFTNSLSAWEVMQDENKLTVMIWVQVPTMLDKAGNVVRLGDPPVPPIKICAVSFPGKNVKRDDFFNSISASVELTPVTLQEPPPAMQEKLYGYEIKSDRTNKLMLIMFMESQIDGTLNQAGVMENPADHAPCPASLKSPARGPLPG